MFKNNNKAASDIDFANEPKTDGTSLRLTRRVRSDEKYFIVGGGHDYCNSDSDVLLL